MELTERDRHVARHMRDQNILQDIDGHRLDCSGGIILVTCSDGDRFYDIFTKKVEVVLYQQEHPRIHVFSWHGGALRLAKLPTPTGRVIRRVANVFFARFGVELIDPFVELAAARAMKNIDTVVLVAHAPCGWAYGKEMDFVRVTRNLVSAKENVKSVIPGMKVKLYPQVHWGPKKDNSYFMSREARLAYQAYLDEAEAAYVA